MATLSPGALKLLREPAFCELATLLSDGSPIVHQLWVDTDGQHVTINTRAKSLKVKNVRRDPRVAVNVVDPGNQWRLVNVRGRVVEVTQEGANADIDRLAKKYRGLEEYPDKDPSNPRVILKISPDHVREVGVQA